MAHRLGIIGWLGRNREFLRFAVMLGVLVFGTAESARRINGLPPTTMRLMLSVLWVFGVAGVAGLLWKWGSRVVCLLVLGILGVLGGAVVAVSVHMGWWSVLDFWYVFMVVDIEVVRDACRLKGLRSVRRRRQC